MNGQHTIADVSRIAGIPKDLLRMWERRYGYPKPARDGNGDRVYSGEELEKLALIRQLVDQGKRPGKLMPLDPSELRSMVKTPKTDLDLEPLFALLKEKDPAGLREWCQQQLQSKGLRVFIHQVMAPAVHAVGEAWARRELSVHEEHLYSELLANLVRQSLAEQYRQEPGGGPRVMLTTVPGERHGLGLLMVEALLCLGGAEVIPFGTEMPFQDIREAASAHRVDVIGLSFSAWFKTEDALVMLSGLRQLTDPGMRIWVGGAAFGSGTVMPEGVELLDGLQGVEQALVTWKQTISGSGKGDGQVLKSQVDG